MNNLKTIPNPETVDNKKELDDIIHSLNEFEIETGKIGVVVKKQNLSFGASYDIISKEAALEKIGKWENSEIYLKSWNKDFFYNLTKKYQ